MVVAAEPGADEASARAVLKRCFCGKDLHVEGELDQRIVGFYEDLRAFYPDHPPYDGGLPWSSMPLDTGIDHVFMKIRWSADNAVLDLIQRLATQHGLVLYDCQDATVYLPQE
jgi:hypothetical protein